MLLGSAPSVSMNSFTAFQAVSNGMNSPTGSGVSARTAVHVARGQVEIGQARLFESATGALFTGKAVSREKASRFDAVRVEVGGRAQYTGRSQFTAEPGDELGGGFLLR